MSIFKKRDKWWILYKLPTGKWRREPVGTSYTLAKQVEAKRKAEVAEGKFFPDRVTNRQSFKSLTVQYLKLHGPTLRSRTWAQMIPHINAELGERSIGSLGPHDIQGFYNKIEARASTATANRYLTLIKSIFNKARAWNLFYGETPCARVKQKQEPSHRLRYLSIDEIKTLMENCHSRLRPIVACALMTGMRRGELRKLDWRDIDFTSNTIHILQSKSGKPRKIPIMPSLRPFLESLGPLPAGSVFNVPDITIRRLYAKALRDSRISSFRFHDLRHTFASHFAMKTGDLPSLQLILGHSTVQMTLRYAHLSDSHTADKMALLAKSLSIEMPTNPPAQRSDTVPLLERRPTTLATTQPGTL